jgi:hyperosmotically inducible periplasmic protein
LSLTITTGENRVKRFQAIKIVSGAIIVLVSLNLYAQGDGAVTASSTASSRTRETKAANRALQKSVRHALSKAKGLSIANIEVRARSGVVTLQGSVPESRQTNLATEVASGVAGVVSVKNLLTVRAAMP